MERNPSPLVSVVVPTLNDAGPLAKLLGQVAATDGFEVVVVDGGSQDDPQSVCEGYGVVFASSEPHRARQMRRGAALARGKLIWFLHADASVEPGVLDALRNAAGSAPWGRFDVRLSNPSPVFGMIAWLMNQRSFLTAICTGDQGIFVSRRLLGAVGGMPDQPLMEDIELSKRLRRLAKPRRLRERLVASSRRWEREGVVQTTILMWSIRLRYFFGAPPEELRARYYSDRPCMEQRLRRASATGGGCSMDGAQGRAAGGAEGAGCGALLDSAGDRVAVFVRVPELGKVKTRLARVLGEEAALDAYVELVEGTLGTLEAGAFNCELWFEGEQDDYLRRWQSDYGPACLRTTEDRPRRAHARGLAGGREGRGRIGHSGAGCGLRRRSSRQARAGGRGPWAGGRRRLLPDRHERTPS